MPKIAREKFKVYQNVFSNYTINNLLKLSSQHYFEYESLSPLSIGKESNVFLANSSCGFVIVKIYRLESCDFNRMFDYIKLDQRYLNLKKQKRKIIFSWAQREYRNLLIAREAQVNAPKPIAIKDNILIIESIGQDEPAPRLKDQPPKNKKKFFENIVENMKRLYKKDLVHGDLSAFNILNHNEEPYFIDFSQATVKRSSNYEELLQRDINNITKYFNKIGLKTNKDYIEKRIKED